MARRPWPCAIACSLPPTPKVRDDGNGGMAIQQGKARFNELSYEVPNSCCRVLRRPCCAAPVPQRVPPPRPCPPGGVPPHGEALQTLPPCDVRGDRVPATTSRCR